MVKKIELITKKHTIYRNYLKRAFDVLLALSGLVVLSPFFLITAIAIKVSSPGPVFFKQQRIMRGKKKFIYINLDQCV